MKKNSNHIKAHSIAANAVIDALGGTVKTAAMFRVDPSTVSCWRKTGISSKALEKDYTIFIRYHKIRASAYKQLLAGGVDAEQSPKGV